MEKSIFLKKHNILLIGFILRRCDQTPWGPKSKPRVSEHPEAHCAGEEQDEIQRNNFFYKNKKPPSKEVLNSVFPGKQSP